jgi:hypothetical protein
MEGRVQAQRIQADWLGDAMKRKRAKAKPMTCVACDFNQAALLDAAEQFNRSEDALKSECLKTASLREELASLKANYIAQTARTHAEHDAELENLKVQLRGEQEYTKRIVRQMSVEIEGLEADVRLQREFLINYNTKGNLLHWFGEFLLAKEKSCTTGSSHSS